MAISKEQKEEMLKQLIEKMKEAKSIVFTVLKGVSVADQQKLRRALRERNAELKVTKKTLIRLAAKEIGVEEISDEALEGQIAVTFSYGEPTTGPQEINKIAKTSKNVVLKGGIFEGRALGLAEVKELADLPSREVLLAKLMGTFMAPLQGFVSCSSGVVAGFVRVLNAHKENLEKAV